MLRILYGADSYSRSQALSRLLGEMDVDGGADVLRFDESVALDQLVFAVNTPPFLAARRVIVVSGLLHRAQPARREGGRGRRGGGVRPPATAPFWLPLVDAVATLPPSTELVMVDDAVDDDNPLLQALRPHAEVRAFRLLPQRDVPGWITSRARETSVRLAPDAVQLLARLCGNNLWAAAGELEKLSLYVEGRLATVADVRALAASVREESVFALIDAIVEGRSREALRLLTELRNAGLAGPYLLSMVSRQYRLLILARERGGGGLGQQDIGRRIGVTNEFALGKVIQQASRIDMARLEAGLARVLEADLAMKRGEQSEDLALELLIVDLIGVA